MKYKRLLSLTMAAALLFGSAAALPEGAFDEFASVSASALNTDTSGKCGENVSWVLEDGVLTISGTGNMTDFKNTSPFYKRTDIKSVVIESGVTSIGYSMFQNCTSLKNVTIPGSVTSIGGWAFGFCTSLTSITIPNSVTSIGGCAFWGCTSLTSITIPSSIKSIEGGAFYGCTNLTSVTIPSSVTSIGIDAFSNTKWLENRQAEDPLVVVNGILIDGKKCTGNVTIPSSVKSICVSAFYDCTSLTSVTIPSSVTSIGSRAFENCSNLTSIVIPDSVNSIGGWAFSGTKWLEDRQKENPLVVVNGILIDGSFCSGEVIIPSNVKTIGDNAFDSNESITSVTIQKGVTSIGNGVFESCLNLTSITIPDGVKSIGAGVFFECESLTSITIPNSVTTIGSGAFYECAINSIVLPDSLTSISDETFFGSALKSVTIPDSVSSIGERAFSECRRLTSVTMPCNVHFLSMVDSTEGNPTINWNFDVGFGRYYGKTIDGFTIYGEKGTDAEKYAEHYGLNFVEVNTTWSEPSWTWNGTTSAKASFTCKHNKSHVVTVDADVSSTCSATCENDGETVYTASVSFDGKNYKDKDTKTVSTNKFGHKYSEPTWTWTGTTAASAKFVCGNDNSHVQTIKAKITASTTKPTFEEAGKTVYTATVVFDGKTYTDTNTVVIPKQKFSFRDLDDGTVELVKYDNSDSEVIIPSEVDGKKVTRIGDNAFYECTSLTSITIPNSVISIGNDAFHNCTSLTSVVIPDSVTSIGTDAFNNCTSLSNVVISNSLTSIANYTFCNCTALTTVTIPSSVTSIGYCSFRDCDSLTNLTIQNGVKSIGSEAFWGCTSLKNITIPNSVTSIGYEAFYCCKSLSSVTIPSNNIFFPEFAFEGCDKLSTLTVQKVSGNSDLVCFSKVTNLILGSEITRVTDINSLLNCLPNISTLDVVEDNEYFSAADGIVFNKDKTVLIRCPKSKMSVDIPETVTTIGDEAFKDCSKLETINIPKSVVSIGRDAFKGTKWLNDKKASGDTFVIANGILLSVNTTSSIVTIPSSVKIIADSAFAGCSSVKAVTIPKSVVSIGDSAFVGTSLASVTIPNSVTTIGASAFAGCPIRNVVIPDSVTSIGDNAFENCSSLTVVSIPKNLTRIGNRIFAGCPISSVTIPSTVTSIGDEAFTGTSLTSVTIPSSVKTIGSGAFSSTPLGSVTISEGVESIGDKAFTGCPLESVDIPASVTSIGKNAFECDVNVNSKNKVYSSVDGVVYDKAQIKMLYCPPAKTKITIPDTLTSLDMRIIKSLSSLKELVLGKGITSIADEQFKGFSKLTSITLTDSVTSIGTSAFEDCKSLTSINIPESVTSIGDGAFMNCSSLSSVTVPNAVESIGPYTFYFCSGLEKLSIGSGVKSIGDGAFSHCSKLTSIIIGNSVETIGQYAFDGCSSLESLTIPDSVKSIDYGAFISCGKLTEVNIPQSVDVVGGYALGYIEESINSAFNAVYSNLNFGKSDYCDVTSNINAPLYSKVKGFTIYGKKGTAAEKYAVENGFKFIAGQKYNEPTWTWNGEKATAKFVSAFDKSIVKTVDAKVTKKITAATCEKDGKTVYTATVTINGKTYTDKKTVKIDKLGHKWGEPTWTWDGVKSASAKFVCANDKSHIETVKETITSKTTKATCEKDGKTVYTATVTFGGKTYTTTKTVKIDKLGHKYGEPTWTWDGVKSATAKFVCANDKSHVKTVEAKITSKTTKATCEADGKTVYTATVTFGGKTYTDIKTVTIKKLGHKFSAWKTTGFDFAKRTSTQTRKCSVCGKTEKQTTKNAVSRLAGDNRYSTAAKLSSTMYKTSDTVVLATGLTYQDALIAVPLASAYNAPLLLGTERHITAQTEAELKRLKAKNVIVVSTNGAIGVKAKAELKALKLNTTYIEGKTCFETASKVATALQKKVGKAPDTIFFATDSAFADALTASPVAAIKNAPIIYLKNKGSIDSATAAYLKSVKGKVKNAFVIGGDGVISNAMMKNVASALGLKVGSTVQRVAGMNRYETCVAVNNKFKNVLSSDGICVAKGLDFPDALAGGVYAAKNRQALFLADGKKLQDVQSSYLKSKNSAKIIALGGTGAVSDDLVKVIIQASV